METNEIDTVDMINAFLMYLHRFELIALADKLPVNKLLYCMYVDCCNTITTPTKY